MSDKLRVGVVGVGYLGKFHARIYSEMEGVDLVGVVDSDAAVAESIAAEYNTRAYTDFRDLLDKVDAVNIVVPTSYHLDVARPFLERGIHMLMEKPIATTVEEGEQLVALAEKAGCIFQVGHLERYNSGLRALIDRMQGKPSFIEVHRLGTFVERATDVDVITDLMIHDIDIVGALMGVPAVKVDASGAHVLTDHIDIANARIEFEGGAVANVTASRVSNKRFRRIRVFGSKQYYSLDFAEQRLEVVTAGDIDPETGRPSITQEKLDIEPQPPLDAELADFIDAVRNKRPPLVDGRTGLEALRMAFKIKESIGL
ncbi:MAG: Gfo/Idh/MocA family oxidoreductase [Gammaproteobacteria bacterium]|nr:Gfo/Idh/MocA family oxidoreductase [Gammaproteobacteria bacterium]